MKSKITPQIRFEHFTDQWQEVEFGSIYEVISGYAFKVSDYVQDGIPIINGESIQHGYINTRNLNFLPQHFADSYKKSILETGDIVLGLNRPIINGRLKIAQIPEALHGSLLYQRAGKIVRLNDTHVDFTYQLLINVISNFVEKKAVGSDQPFISTTLLKKWLIHMPLLEREQEKIGNFLKSLDDSIALQQQELTILKQTKQGFLQKMFPQEGEAVPEVRFPGFNDDWQKLKLDDLAESFEYGLNASATKYDGINKYIRITDIDDKSNEFSQANLTSPDIDLTVAENYLVKEGDILVARTGASVGKSYIYDEADGKVYYAGFLIRVRIKKEYNPEFVFQNTLTSQYHKFIKITSQRSGQPGVNAQEYASFLIMTPSTDEQNQIGKFFKQLDEVIALQEQELKALKQTKKAFLQKMFV